MRLIIIPRGRVLLSVHVNIAVIPISVVVMETVIQMDKVVIAIQAMKGIFVS